MMVKILIVHGPNFNLLGIRQPEIYGSSSLKKINQMLKEHAIKISVNLKFFFSNFEGKIINFIQKEAPKAQGIVFNLGAYTHTSIAILDSLVAFPLKKVEVHMSNIYKRESFRHYSPYHSISDAIIIGAGPMGYILALDALINLIKN